MHAGEIDANLEDVGVARQRLRGEHAAVGQAPDADAVGVDVGACLQILAAGSTSWYSALPRPPVFGAVRNDLP
jgi:hypothetical protein